MRRRAITLGDVEVPPEPERTPEPKPEPSRHDFRHQYSTMMPQPLEWLSAPRVTGVSAVWSQADVDAWQAQDRCSVEDESVSQVVSGLQVQIDADGAAFHAALESSMKALDETTEWVGETFWQRWCRRMGWR